MPTDALLPDPWAFLRRHTPARIALGRSGGSLPTARALELAHAQALARDAVQAPFDADEFAARLRPLDPGVLVLRSAAGSRAQFLARPDLGRRLCPESERVLGALPEQARGRGLVILVSDGLSALAAWRQAPGLLAALLPRLEAHGFTRAPLLVVRHARVGIVDPVGSALRAEMALILLGERPGMASPDSLGAYFAYGPGPGRTDGDRNCVSNIRPEGLAHEAAAEKIAALLAASRHLRLSGVGLKEGPDAASLSAAQSPAPLGIGSSGCGAIPGPDQVR